MLHMNLRIVTGMINRCVFDFLGDYGDAEEQAAALLAILGGSNVWMRAGALKPTSKDANAAYVKDISFVGRDCEVVVDLAPRMLEVIFPAAQRQDDSDIQEAYERALRCWTVWALLWRQLNDDIDVYDEEARNTRADVVQKLADEWLPWRPGSSVLVTPRASTSICYTRTCQVGCGSWGICVCTSPKGSSTVKASASSLRACCVIATGL